MVVSELNELSNVVRGRVLSAGHEDFDRARRPWNLAVEQPVRAVVEAADATDVAALVRHARSAGLTVTAQPSGHGATGDVDEAILLRTGALNEIHVDPEARTARVGAGVKWGEVQAVAGSYGLTGLPGSSPVVSVTGYTLGGGLSWFGRKHGWAADGVRAFEIVDADGNPSRVTADSDADLFWALRGGSGDFALVTAVEFDLHPAPRLFGGRMMWSADRASAVMDAFRAVTASAPDELTVWLDLLKFPGAAPLVAVDATYLGDADEARDLLAAFDRVGGALSDTRADLPIAELGSITAEPTDPSPGMSRAELLTDLDEVAAKALLAAPIDPLLSVQIRHLGGALARPSDSPHGALTEPYYLYMFGIPGTPEAAEAIKTRRQAMVDAVAPYVSGRKPYTALAVGDTAADAFAPDALARLRQIKRDRDPQGTFRSNFPVLA
jgi:FAD/FMN-containing dehydrogenase